MKCENSPSFFSVFLSHSYIFADFQTMRRNLLMMKKEILSCSDEMTWREGEAYLIFHIIKTEGKYHR